MLGKLLSKKNKFDLNKQNIKTMPFTGFLTTEKEKGVTWQMYLGTETLLKWVVQYSNRYNDDLGGMLNFLKNVLSRSGSTAEKDRVTEEIDVLEHVISMVKLVKGHYHGIFGHVSFREVFSNECSELHKEAKSGNPAAVQYYFRGSAYRCFTFQENFAILYRIYNHIKAALTLKIPLVGDEGATERSSFAGGITKENLSCLKLINPLVLLKSKIDNSDYGIDVTALFLMLNDMFNIDTAMLQFRALNYEIDNLAEHSIKFRTIAIEFKGHKSLLLSKKGKKARTAWDDFKMNRNKLSEEDLYSAAINFLKDNKLETSKPKKVTNEEIQKMKELIQERENKHRPRKVDTTEVRIEQNKPSSREMSKSFSNENPY